MPHCWKSHVTAHLMLFHYPSLSHSACLHSCVMKFIKTGLCSCFGGIQCIAVMSAGSSAIFAFSSIKLITTSVDFASVSSTRFLTPTIFALFLRE